MDNPNTDTDGSESGCLTKIPSLCSNYVFIKRIGKGSFGEVYLAQHKGGGYVAAKVEDNDKTPRIIQEFKIYRYLNKLGLKQGIPKIYAYLETTNSNIMIMQLLGPNLDDLFTKYNKRFKLSTVFMLGKQMVNLLRGVHFNKIIHRDIKPSNFTIGRKDRDQLYIMDFGLAKKYIVKGKHNGYRDNRSPIGTVRYSSINMHMGIEPSRRDELESVGYILVYFLKGSLPWQGLKKKKDVTSFDRIGEVKMCTSLDKLCEGIPRCFRSYLEYCRQLKYDEEPDYDKLLNMFDEDAKIHNITPKYEWH